MDRLVAAWREGSNGWMDESDAYSHFSCMQLQQADGKAVNYEAEVSADHPILHLNAAVCISVLVSSAS